ncbi:MAG: recombinase family protein [Cellulomonadaceae bacterium]
MSQHRLVGIVVDHVGFPDLLTQCEQLVRAGVDALDQHVLAPMTMEDWRAALDGVLDALGAGDVVVVPALHALGVSAHDLLTSLRGLAARGTQLVVTSTGLDTRTDGTFWTSATAIVTAVDAGQDARTRALLDSVARDPRAKTPPKARAVDAASYQRALAAHA